MADWTYQIIDQSGKERKGNIVAESEAEAKNKLKMDGNMVISLTKATALTKEISFSVGGKVKPRDLSVFCRQFTSMVNAGVTILDTLDMLSDQTENKVMAKAIRGVHAEIQKGETLSDGLKKYPNVFPDIVIVASAVVIVMLVKVIPSYSEMFNDLGTELPGITKAVVAMSDFVTGYWYIVIAVIAAIVIAIKLYKQTDSGQMFFGNLARKVPVFGKLNIKTAASNYARTLSTLVYSGLPMIEALGITADTMKNALYKKALKSAREEVSKGVPLSEPITACGLFPPMVSHMTRIGEETGDLEGMLTRLADYYDEEVELATQTVMAAIEPMIILVLALIVGVLVAAVMAPMLTMYQAMDSL